MHNCVFHFCRLNSIYVYTGWVESNWNLVFHFLTFFWKKNVHFKTINIFLKFWKLQRRVTRCFKHLIANNFFVSLELTYISIISDGTITIKLLLLLKSLMLLELCCYWCQLYCCQTGVSFSIFFIRWSKILLTHLKFWFQFIPPDTIVRRSHTGKLWWSFESVVLK